MNIKEIMNPSTEVISASTPLKDVGKKMADTGVGFLLVGENDKLKGTVTDRDIVLKAVGQGKDVGSTPVSDILSPDIVSCNEEQDVEEVARTMATHQVRRVPVVNGEMRLVGIVSIGDIAQHLSSETAGQVLRGVTSEQHPA